MVDSLFIIYLPLPVRFFLPCIFLFLATTLLFSLRKIHICREARAVVVSSRSCSALLWNACRANAGALGVVREVPQPVLIFQIPCVSDWVTEVGDLFCGTNLLFLSVPRWLVSLSSLIWACTRVLRSALKFHVPLFYLQVC